MKGLLPSCTTILLRKPDVDNASCLTTHFVIRITARIFIVMTKKKVVEVSR